MEIDGSARAAARRRRITAVAATIAALIALNAWYAATPALPAEPDTRPGIAMLPEHYHGHRIVAVESTRFDDPVPSFAWTPTSTTFSLFVSCARDWHRQEVGMVVLVNG